MPNEAGAAFIVRQLPPTLAGLRVVEVGARTSGSNDVRDLVTPRGPATYVGVDIGPGLGVDVVGRAETLVAAVGSGSADLVIAAEVMEHVRDWQAALLNMKLALRPGGRLIFTTRSPGYPFHVSPFDFWRYTPDAARAIVADLIDVVVENDPSMPGVFVAARRPPDFRPADLSGYALVSVLTGRPETSVRERWIWRKRFSSPRRVISFLLPYRAKRWLWSALPRRVAEPLRRRPPA